MESHQVNNELKSFIELGSIVSLDQFLEGLSCTTEEEMFLRDYFRTTSHRDDESARMYMFLMLCYFFKNRAHFKISARWNAYITSPGFQRLVHTHLNFDMSPNDFVDECFKLWIITSSASSTLQHPSKR